MRFFSNISVCIIIPQKEAVFEKKLVLKILLGPKSEELSGPKGFQTLVRRVSSDADASAILTPALLKPR